MNSFSARANAICVLVGAALALATATGCSSADLAGSGTSANSGAPGTGGAASTGGGAAAGASTSTGGANSTGGNPAQVTGGAANSAVPTWSQLYSNYFGPATAGNCVGSGCHGSGLSPAFNSATSMCNTLKSYGYIGAGAAGLSAILTWFNQGGNMPANGNAAPANAVADITAWQNAGSVCP